MRHCWGTTTMPRTRSGHDRDRSRDHPLRGIAPVKGHYTRSERVQCLRIGCTTPRHKLTDLPEWRSTDPTGLAGPGGAVQTANGARRRQGLAGLRDNAPSGRAAEPGRQGTHTTRPDGRAHIQRGRGQPRATARPSPGLVKKSSQAIHHEMREGLQRLLRLALR